MKTVFSILFWMGTALPGLAQAKTIDRTIIAINNDIILESDIARFQKKLQSKGFQDLFGGIDPKALKDRSAVLQLLIEETLVDQQVKRLELQATEQEVEAQIKTITKRNGISPGQLQERLKQLGTTMDDYRAGIKRQIERRNLIDREIKPSLEVTDEQLRHFYLRQGAGSGKDSQYRISHILCGDQSKAATLYEMLKGNPDQFASVAKESSEDSATAENGGDLGFLSLSSLSTELKKVVPKLSIGTVSKPVKTPAGYHLLRVLDVKSNDFATIPKEQKDALRNQMINSEVEKKMLLWLERKKSEAHIVKTEEVPDVK